MMPDESKASNATPASEKVVAANLEQMTVSELRQLIARAQALEGNKIEQEKKKLKFIIQRDAKQLGFSLDINWTPIATSEPEAKAPKKSRGKVAIKYRGPDGEEWSGRGRHPRWVAALKAEGRNLEEFRIE